jgi:A/G-specific adenine glycosylase
VWAGLCTPPLSDSSTALEESTAGWPGHGAWLPTLQHALTHFDWTLHPLHWHWPARSKAAVPLAEGRWFVLPAALALGLPAPVRRLLERL